MRTLSFRPATIQDIDAMVALSYQKRRAYEHVQPQFWRYAGEKAEITQAKWFEELLSREDSLLWVAEEQEKILGFIIGTLISAPEVYDPGGLTLMIDDFCVAGPELWENIGGQLLLTLQRQARSKGAVQTVVVCGAHDEAKQTFLKQKGLLCASEWYVNKIEENQK